MIRIDLRGAAIGGCLLALGAPLGAQSLAHRIAAVNGDAVLRFAARAGVCGDGRGSMSIRSTTHGSSDGEWQCACEPGPVRVVLTVRKGTVDHLRTDVGERHGTPAPGVTDLGTVPAREAADYFLELARTAGDQVSADAVWPVALADSVTVWPALLELAQNGSRSIETRKHALFWAGEIGDTPTDSLVALHARFHEPALQRHLVFVLSQHDDSMSTTALMDIAQHDSDRDMRRQAMFWLGQKHDPRVVAFIANILEH